MFYFYLVLFHLILGKEIQDKWRSLRFFFSRELRDQRNVTSGQAACKRRKYIYFDRLLFLLPHTKPRSTASNLAEGEGEEKNEAVDDRGEVTAEPGDGIITRQRSAMKATGKPKQISFENQILEMLSAKQQAGTDEDVTFANSLLPFLKRVSEDKKIDARIEILQVLRRFTNTQPVQLQ
jgi:hypothetical protein